MSEFTKQEMAQAVLQALLALKEDGPAIGEIGICGNVSETLDAEFVSPEIRKYWGESRDVVFENWDDPAASGCITFPIEGNYMVEPRYMWVEGEYAAARRRLVDHLIEHYTSLAEEE
jgi:hypothetical protein